MNRRALLLVVTGVVAAIAATVVIYFLITNMTPPPPPEVLEPTDERRVVVVAATDIAASSVVAPAQITTGTYPIDMIPADAITSVNAVLSQTARVPIFSGQILLQRQFIDAGGEDIVSASVTPGKVLVAFPSTDMLNATGAVRRGDHVDIMLSIPISGTARIDAGADTETQVQTGERALVAQTTLQNIIVKNVGLWTDPNAQAQNAAASQLKVITFEVDPQEALILKFVKDSGGTIDLAIRSAADSEIKTTDPVTIDYLADVFDFFGVGRARQPIQAATPATPTPTP